MKITEQNYTPIPRLVTGMYSFDRAFENARREIGIPLNGIMEVYGHTHLG